MDAMDDMELLREYASRGSEAAFTTLVERHIGLIYSAAMRRFQDSGLAEEVTQTVFIVLARKARSLAGRKNLSGWLYQATRLAGLEALRSQIRRQEREQEAAQMDTPCIDTPSWEHLAPLLDQAMDELGEKDREAVLLRFFENKTMGKIGAALGDRPCVHNRVRKGRQPRGGFSSSRRAGRQ